MSDEVYCILDTSIFLQCTFFPDVDWLAVLSAKQVCLLVPITVLDELDKHKTDPASNRRRERARRVIRELNDRQAALV